MRSVLPSVLSVLQQLWVIEKKKPNKKYTTVVNHKNYIVVGSRYTTLIFPVCSHSHIIIGNDLHAYFVVFIEFPMGTPDSIVLYYYYKKKYNVSVRCPIVVGTLLPYRNVFLNVRLYWVFFFFLKINIIKLKTKIAVFYRSTLLYKVSYPLVYR